MTASIYRNDGGWSGWTARPVPEMTDRRQAQFWSKVEDTGFCWLWTGGLLRGYGRFSINDMDFFVHRVSYRLLIGPIPTGMQLDHLCRIRHCVNPDHLEPVPNHVNLSRGQSPTARHARQTHCVHGHEFDEHNTVWSQGGRRRQCRECHRLHLRSSRLLGTREAS